MTVADCIPLAGTSQCAAAFDSRPWEKLEAWSLTLDASGNVYIPLCTFRVPSTGVLTPFISGTTPAPMTFYVKWDCGGSYGLSLYPALVLYEQASQSYVSEVDVSGMSNYPYDPIESWVGTYCNGKESGLSAPVDLPVHWNYTNARPTTYTWFLKLYSTGKTPISQNLFIKTAGAWGFMLTPSLSLASKGRRRLQY